MGLLGKRDMPEGGNTKCDFQLNTKKREDKLHLKAHSNNNSTDPPK